MGGKSSKEDGQVINHVNVDNKMEFPKEGLIVIYVTCGILFATLLFKLYQSWYRGLRKRVTRSNAVDSA